MTQLPRRPAPAGMTLIELLAASAVLFLLFTAVYALVLSSLRMREGVEQASRPFAVGPVVMQRVTEDLRNALVEPFTDKDAFRGATESVAGETVSNVDFITSVPSRTLVEIDDEWVESGYCEVGYKLRRSEQDSDLMALYRREDFGVDDKPFEGGKFYKVCDRVRSFRIDYFKDDPGDPGGDDAEGEEEWEGKKERRLPWACRVSLVLVEPEGSFSEDEELKQYHFIRYVAFPSRRDRVDDIPPADPGGDPAPGDGG